MDVRYPFVIIIVSIISLIVIFLRIGKKKIDFSDGSRIANTNFIKNTDYYKRRVKVYKFILNTIYVCLFVSILAASVLLARVSVVDTSTSKQYNRDIFLCMDVSTSVNELNMQLISNLKDTVKSLKGERFGISIFNTTSVTLVPLTDDYEYVLEVLDKLYESIKTYENMNYFDPNYYSKMNYFISGTIEGNEERGSSLIGDGLATCVYSFPKLDEDRTRIIIFSTDNELAGKPMVTLSKAGDIAKKKNVKVFGIGTTIMKDKDRDEFEAAVVKTGGKFYEQKKSTVKHIVDDVEKTSKSMLDTQDEVRRTDVPFMPFVVLLLSLGLVGLVSKKVIK